MVGLLLLGGGAGTGARWTAQGTVPGATVATGVLDLRVDGQDAIADYAPLDVANLMPGLTRAAVVTVTNAGDAPLDYVVTTSGTDPDGRGLLAQLALAVTTATATTPAGGGSSCGGASVAGVTGTAGGVLVSVSRRLAPGSSEKLCVQVGLPLSAPPAVAGAGTALTIAVASSSGGWTDAVPIAGSTLATVTLATPVVSCGTGLIGAIGLTWTAVPGATGYVVRSGTLGTVLDTLGAGGLGTVLSGLLGDVTVQAVFGSSTWVSPPSAPRHLSALAGILGVCT